MIVAVLLALSMAFAQVPGMRQKINKSKGTLTSDLKEGYNLMPKQIKLTAMGTEFGDLKELKIRNGRNKVEPKILSQTSKQIVLMNFLVEGQNKILIKAQDRWGKWMVLKGEFFAHSRIVKVRMVSLEKKDVCGQHKIELIREGQQLAKPIVGRGFSNGFVFFGVPPGRYAVKATLGSAAGEAKLEVRDKDVAIEVPVLAVNAGNRCDSVDPIDYVK